MTEIKEDEIEVTPEMVEAGILELLTRDPRVESDDDVVARIYTAMRKAHGGEKASCEDRVHFMSPREA